MTKPPNEHDCLVYLPASADLDGMMRTLGKQSATNSEIEQELRIAKLQELSSLTPGQVIELEILLNKKWK